jgi:FkbM family methyltransferase
MRAVLDELGRRLLLSTAAVNPAAVVARRLGIPVPIRLLNGFTIPGTRLSNITAVNLVRLSYLGAELGPIGANDRVSWGVSFDPAVLVTPTGIRFDLEAIAPTILAETFIYDVHFAGSDLSGKLVVDAGAFVGDTALYFAQRGAQVLAYEPDPDNFRLLKRNLSLNPELSRRIRCFNAAVGESGTMRMTVGLGSVSGGYLEGGESLHVPSCSLGDILADCPGREAFLLKADCKGSEFKIVRQPGLAQFERLSIEYSADLVGEDLATLLSWIEHAGHHVERIFKHNFACYTLKEHGTVFASRGARPA